MFRRISLGLLFATLSLALTACGGTNNDQGPPTAEAREAETARTAALLAKSAEINVQELTAAQNQSAASDGSQTAPAVVTKASARSAVYRFYNTQTGAHFYTISASERDTVKSTLPVFAYEGVAFYVSAAADTGLSPVYRFYNTQTGVHFYSISADEKRYIEAELPQFKYEGIGYYASKTALSGMVPLYRFYVTSKGFHFYTASAVEKDRIRAQLPNYQFENVGYYVFGSSAEQFAVGGSISGLASGASVVLQLNGGGDLTLSANGAFTFGAGVDKDATYTVTVKTQPVGQVCTVSNGSGTATAAVASVSVSCVAASYGVGGSISGLNPGQSLVLRNNGTGDLTLTANGVFAFGAPVVYGDTYSVTVAAQPTGQTCTVSNGSGTVAGGVGNVVVICATNTYPVGGSISGLTTGQSVELQINGGGALTRSASGAFVFATPLTFGSTYLVSIRSQPVGQLCSVFNGSGTVSGPVSNVSVVCQNRTYTVGGTISGLAAGRQVVLLLNGLHSLTRTSNDAFYFNVLLAHGSSYTVVVASQPLGQTCSVINGTGTITGPVTSVQVSCSTNTYTVGGSIVGLGAGKSVVLQNNAGNNLTRNVNGNFVFSAAVPYGAPYAVSVLTQPSEQTCSVANGLGTVGGQVSNVAVSCVDHVTVSGVLSGLITGNPVVLTLNGGGDLTLPGNGGFTFTTKTPLGATYVVGVKTQPRGQTCTVGNGTGTAAAAVSNVTVSCTSNPTTDLLITEVGGCPWDYSSGCWLEVFNPTATTLNLSSYRLRSGVSAASVKVFDLPSVNIAPGEFRILAGNVTGDVPVTALNPVVMLGNASSWPFWSGWSGTGLVELLSMVSGNTVDAVRFGGATAPAPITAAHWVGDPVPAGFVGGVSDQSRSIVRPQATMSSQDSQSALDWVAVDYATPGGTNDVAPGAVDTDHDGIPDANETPGSTYNGLDLYAMGARVGQKDVFVEVDHMDSTTVDLAPRLDAMQTLKNVFAANGLVLHLDVGSVFASGFDPGNFNLGQGTGKVAYQACLGWASTDCASNTSANYRTVYDWKWQHFDPRRRPIFHYALIGDRSAGGESGRGELFGNDLTITAGTGSGGQAGLFMHELGHNLGLRHGGDEEVQYKPNYLSVMNYLYVWDVPPQGDSVWPFRKWKWFFGNGAGMYPCFSGNTDPNCAVQAPYSINYSSGVGVALSESALYESANVGRGALPGVYADWDENGSLTTVPVSRDLNGDGVLGVLTDHNDWAAITLPFVRQSSGGLMQKSFRVSAARKAAKVPETGPTVPNPVLSDRGPTVITCVGDAGSEKLLKPWR
ncbi:MAG: hypothetical protein KDF54_11270 [Hydrogenophaga sp.]|nr:hypothetical protein [Hydrogenophaga sp.]